MTQRKKRQPVPIGPSGKNVGDNTFIRRGWLSLTQEDLSARLASRGIHLAVPAIRDIENGRRRVDADELTALAYALDTYPNDLLLPAEAQGALTGLPAGLDVQEISWWLQGKQLEPNVMVPLWGERLSALEKEIQDLERPAKDPRDRPPRDSADFDLSTLQLQDQDRIDLMRGSALFMESRIRYWEAKDHG
ncbi:helix-turn-helix domain-containing protein [Schaalia sp. JY-X169]|uniref:helix-turn-helix domain-containing protein n=1 Tax=Schaalia sp. JY-X169 TaxID=2758572 RepID=UPI0015F40BE4|nr:helix-turn-helix transcriptional regulator [Schaalia sp. JY-X169]